MFALEPGLNLVTVLNLKGSSVSSLNHLSFASELILILISLLSLVSGIYTQIHLFSSRHVSYED